MSKAQVSTNQILATTEHWLRNFVIAHQLCPFAERELNAQRIRFTLTTTQEPEELLQYLADELDLLTDDASIATTLLVHPYVLEDFGEYNDFLDLADALLHATNLEGIFQVASFHPHYQFADCPMDDAANFTNRSPYPLLHLLREDDVARAIASHPDIHSVPQRNIAYLRSLPDDCFLTGDGG